VRAEKALAEPVGVRTASWDIHRLLAVLLRTAKALYFSLRMESLKEHQALMFAAYYLRRAPCYLDTRGTRNIPVVIVPSNSKVTKPGRVVLWASIYKALAIVSFDCARTQFSRTAKPGIRNRREV
jgi:hypothetical protein